MNVLAGMQFLVTRPVSQAENLCRLIESQAGFAFRFPTLEIRLHTPELNILQQALASDWLIFTSSNAVDFAIQAFDGKMHTFELPLIAAIGQATANTLTLNGIQVDCVPVTEFNSEGLLAEPLLQDVAGKICVIVRGVGGREKLAETLRSRGAEIIYLEVYKRFCPNINNLELTAWIAADKITAVIITSSEALDNLLLMLDKESVALLKNKPLIVVSDRIRLVAEQLGFIRIVVSQQPTDSAILDTLMTLFNGENSGRSNRTTTRNASHHLGG